MKKLTNYLIVLFAVATALMYIMMLSSCSSQSGQREPIVNTTTWRARSLHGGKLLFVENLDSLPVRAKDTVLCQYDTELGMYWITNTGLDFRDTSYIKQCINNTDTTDIYFEMINVVLDTRSTNP